MAGDNSSLVPTEQPRPRLPHAEEAIRRETAHVCLHGTLAGGCGSSSGGHGGAVCSLRVEWAPRRRWGRLHEGRADGGTQVGALQEGDWRREGVGLLGK